MPTPIETAIACFYLALQIMFDLFFFTVNEMVSTGPLDVAFHKSRFIVATAATKFFSTEKCKKAKETFNQGRRENGSTVG